MQQFSNADGIRIVHHLIRVVQDNRQYLSDIDGQIGDGDHGINMSKGFTLCQEQLDSEPHDLAQGFSALSRILMTRIGGSMGPLYGYLFKAMGGACDGVEQIDGRVFGAMLTACREGIEKISQARPGDKTLMDVLVPAVEAYQGGLAEGVSFHECLDRMSAAAEGGRDSTRDMVARVGRSSRLGERSRGVIDAGAASCCLILTSMAETIKGLTRTA